MLHAPFNGASCLLTKECAVSTAVSLALAIDEIDDRGDKQERMLGAQRLKAGVMTILKGPL